MLKLRTYITALIIVLSLAVITLAGELDGYLVILHSNDVHGRAYTTDQFFGYAGIKQAKENLISQGADVLLLDAGDFSQGTPIVNLSQGANAFDFMNLAGYDASTLGNHEFDWGSDNLFKNAERAKFKILCCNILRVPGDELIFEPRNIFTLKNGDKIGVFGLETPECATKVHPDKSKGVRFLGEKDMYNAAQTQIAELRQNDCKLVIALGHLGDSDETAPNRSIDLIANTRGIDLFIDGHSHTRIPNGSKEGKTLRVSTGEFSKAIGYVAYKLNKDGNYDFVKCGLFDKDNIFAPIMASANLPMVDEELKAHIDNINEEIVKELSKPTGKTLVELNGERNPGNRTEETNLGDFVADAILWEGQQCDKDVVVGIANGGSIRAGLKKGDISMIDLKTCCPYGNTVCVLAVKGSELLEAMETATYTSPDELGAFPQVSGMEMTVDTTVPWVPGEQYPDSTYYAPKAPGSRVTITSVGGKPFDPEAIYKIATADFLAAGGDTYYAFKYGFRTAGENTGILVEDAMVEYTTNVLGGVIDEKYAEPQGRIKIIK
ncbi:MAG: bifunctional metallophosphatase/5'-nucleotidase [Abditibacteriota bacterium]|nr:bifunctional metallophosphatase/5'-nucleotidase [Abditibacteriota bacterium]